MYLLTDKINLQQVQLSGMFHAAPAERSDAGWVVPHEPLGLARFQLVNRRRAAEPERQRGCFNFREIVKQLSFLKVLKSAWADDITH